MNFTSNAALEKVVRHFEPLGKVKRSGTGYNVFNPLIPKQRTGSVYIRADGDRVLIHDFAGYGAAEILAAVGLSLADLFDKPLTNHLPRSREHIAATALIRSLRNDLLLVLCAMTMVINGTTVQPSDIELLSDAAERIREALAFGGHIQ